MRRASLAFGVCLALGWIGQFALQSKVVAVSCAPFALGSSVGMIHRWAARAICKVDEPSTIEEILRDSARYDAQKRSVVDPLFIESLGRCGETSAKALATLVTRNTYDRDLRNAELEILTRMGPPATVAVAVACDRNFTSSAVTLLVGYARRDEKGFFQALDTVVATGLCTTAAVAAVGGEESLARLRRALESADSEVRAEAARSLGQVRDKEAGEILVRRLLEAQRLSRSAASEVEALAKIGHAKAAEVFLQLLRRPVEEPPSAQIIRNAIISGLADTGDASVVPTLISLGDVCEALVGLGRLGGPKAAAHLEAIAPPLASRSCWLDAEAQLAPYPSPKLETLLLESLAAPTLGDRRKAADILKRRSYKPRTPADTVALASALGDWSKVAEYPDLAPAAYTDFVRLSFHERPLWSQEVAPFRCGEAPADWRSSLSGLVSEAVRNGTLPLFKYQRFRQVLVWDQGTGRCHAMMSHVPLDQRAAPGAEGSTLFIVDNPTQRQVGTYSVSGQPGLEQRTKVYVVEMEAADRGRGVASLDIVSTDPVLSRQVVNRPDFGDVAPPVLTFIASVPVRQSASK